jgi:hypothetical protein
MTSSDGDFAAKKTVFTTPLTLPLTSITSNFR